LFPKPGTINYNLQKHKRGTEIHLQKTNFNTTKPCKTTRNLTTQHSRVITCRTSKEPKNYTNQTNKHFLETKQSILTRHETRNIQTANNSSTHTQTVSQTQQHAPDRKHTEKQRKTGGINNNTKHNT